MNAISIILLLLVAVALVMAFRTHQRGGCDKSCCKDCHGCNDSHEKKTIKKH